MSNVVSIDRSGGRVMVLADTLPVPLIRVAGSWSVGTFSADDLKDNCDPVSNGSKEETALIQEAAAALESNPDLAGA